jgi:uncharacterized protein (TIGR02246 family)
MRKVLRAGMALVLLLVSSAALAEEAKKRIDLDRCIGGKCKFGRFVSITVSAEWFLLRIEPNWCRGSGYECKTSYARFTQNDMSGADLRVTSYELGTKSSTMFTVYVPRHANAVYIHDVNGTGRDAILDLRPFQKYVQPADPLGSLSTGTSAPKAATPAAEIEATPPAEPAAAEPPPATPAPDTTAPQPTITGGRAGDTLAVDGLFRRFSEAYETLNVDTIADVYTEDALYLGPEGNVVRGRGAIAERFGAMFARAAEGGQSLKIAFTTVERALEGSTGYEVGYYRLERESADGTSVSRGKFALVLRREGRHWRIHVDSYSPAPPAE